MELINFENLPSTNTPINAQNLNQMQKNVKDVFDGNKSMGSVVVEDIVCKNLAKSSATGITSQYQASLYIDFDMKANTTYTISFKSNLGQEYFYPNEYIFKEAIWKSTNDRLIVTVTSLDDEVVADKSNLGYAILKNALELKQTPVFTDIQIEEGPVATELAEHKEFGFISGSNANGNYIKYPDGTMVCYGKVSTILSSLETPANGFYYNYYDFTFPEVFVEQPIVTPMLSQNTGVFTTSLGNYQPTKTTVQIRVQSADNFTDRQFTIGYIAIGRWK